MKITPKFIEEKTAKSGQKYHRIVWTGGEALSFDAKLTALLQEGVGADIEVKPSKDGSQQFLNSVNGVGSERTAGGGGQPRWGGKSPEERRSIERQVSLKAAIDYLTLVSKEGIILSGPMKGKEVNSQVVLGVATAFDDFLKAGGITKE